MSLPEIIRLVELFLKKEEIIVFLKLRRDSYDRLRIIDDDYDSDSRYTCACGQEYMSEATLKRHQVC